ncbi:MAG TPA: preprotein translocase subunit YajC [Candidatus Binatia bacterium]|nr:preprotein translocase subunit YajC [Candidatus Binatia bacterium]
MNQLTLAQMTGGDGPSAFAPAVMMIAIFAIFYFLVIRPQQTKERQKDEFRSKLKKGDEVLAAGGLYGRVVDIKGSVISVEVAANVRVRVDRKTIEPLAARPKAEERESSGA